MFGLYAEEYRKLYKQWKREELAKTTELGKLLYEQETKKPS